MKEKEAALPGTEGFTGPSDRQAKTNAIGVLASRDHDVVRRWAARHNAEPATGEATASGPATIHVTDGGVGIRFNFPAAARFRPITWDEWFDHFDRYHLTFVYEEEVADRAYKFWQARGVEEGKERDDWFEAERPLGRAGGALATRYRFVRQDG
jgi:DUF2934 family protein